jgi:UPF0716 family protein affecting phage T7 exclusion
MIALGALKVAAVAVAVTVAAFVTIAAGIASLDANERRIGARDGQYLADCHPWMVAAALMLVAGGITAAFALLLAAIAWAVGA